MKKIAGFMMILFMILLIPIVHPHKQVQAASDALPVFLHDKIKSSVKIRENMPFKRFLFSSEYHFEYPDAVRGIYVTGNSAGGSRFRTLLDMVEKTELNTMVIDIKDDNGNLTFRPDEDSPYTDIAKDYIKEPKKMMKLLEKKGIYPIARVVVFKDTELAKKHPEWSFKENGKVWVNGKNEAFVSPFQKDVWKYNVNIAKMAAEMGFQEIQFDYVRFPEGFESRDKTLEYNKGEYASRKENDVKRRVQAVTDFVTYAKKELAAYDVKIGVDIFGYAATIPETPGIGQNFSKISENVDVISSMIYPSHWGNNYFDIPFPDKEPYRLVNEYAKVEKKVLGALDSPPVSRPWIQDFDAPWLYSGPPTHYGKAEVEAQIKALKKHGIKEYLLWNAGNTYTQGVNYTP